MRTNLHTIFKYSWGLMMSTANTWEVIRTDNSVNRAFTSFVLPWTVLLSVILSVFSSLYTKEKVIETAIVMLVVTAISYIASFFLSRSLAISFFRKNHSDIFSKTDISKIIAYSFSVIYITKIITTIIPDLFFLQILNVYTVYIVWEACHVFFNLNEDERGKSMLLISLCVIFMPSLIRSVIMFMLPGF
ncbi:MAG: DUF1282 family protein [Paludibacteraceae bacterium]|nr:DUF1282 family protein [Paludibacteraceae bacterium]